MDTKIVIFGCGKLGHEAIDVLGSENVLYFCDNSPTMIGTEQYGKRVISFAELREIYNEVAVIICANVRCGNAWAMAQQCEENGVSDYFLYQSLREKPFFPKREKMLPFLDNAFNRQIMKNGMYISKTKELQKQVGYLKRHIDIRHIKPAGGKLREWQIMIVKETAELLDRLSSLEIKPFLYGGNLLGYVRHNGFIPWDDDMDFGIMRGEYERLRDYCSRHMYTQAEFYGEKQSNKNVREELKNYYYSNGGGDLFNIHYPLVGGRKVVVDFFVMDYYADHYSYEDLMKAKDEIRIQLNDAIIDQGKAGSGFYDDEKRIVCFQKALKKNRENLAEESNHIYFGIDNMEMMHRFHRGGFIPRDIVFPLKKVLFEGSYFYVPNDAEEFLKYEYENIWKLPDDVGIPQHLKLSNLTDENEW